MNQENEIQLLYLNNDFIDVVLCNYGCTIVSINVPDKEGVKRNVIAGFSNPDDYKKDHPYLGSTVGRFANRIAYGKFRIDDNEYILQTNDGVNHLHGGINGFHRRLWNAEQNEKEIVFTYLSKDGEEGYPGNLRVSVCFSLTNNKLDVNYKATTDKSTVINLTNHSYFNLSGFESSTIYNHYLKIYADSYTVKNETNVPSGEIAPVSNTPYDFRNSKLIGQEIAVLTTDKGYDINYVLGNNTTAQGLAAELYEPLSGRLLKVYTDQPGMQVYTANWWDGSLAGPQGKKYVQHGAVALETQNFPDAPNHPNFPSAVLLPRANYETMTSFEFSVQ